MDQPDPRDGLREPTPLSWKSSVTIALYCAGLFLVQFGHADVLNYHEAFYGGPAREFLVTGDWIAPRVGGVLSWLKPPLSLWAMAASMAVFGTEAEWAVRLPTHLATLASALAVAALAARWHGDRIGRLAGLVQLTTAYCLMQGRLAEPDMLLCATVTAAFAVFARAIVPGPDGAAPARSRWLPKVFFVIVGLSFMTKGPVGPALIAVGCGLYALLTRDRRAWLFLLDPLGWLLMLAVGLPWYVAGYRRDPFGFTNFLYINIVLRFRGGLTAPEETKGPFFYLYYVPILLLPWTHYVALGWVSGPREGERPRALGRFLACWFVAGLALLSMASWKNKHYAIPVLPPLTVFAAYGLDRSLSWRWRPWASRALGAAVAVLMIGAVALLAVGRAKHVYQLELAAPLLPLAAAGTLLTGSYQREGRARAATVALFGTILCVFVTAKSLLFPAFVAFNEQTALARRTNARAAPGEPILGYRLAEPQAFYYLRHPVERFDDWTPFLARVVRAPASAPLLVVAPARFQADVARLGRVELLDQCPNLQRLTVLRLTPRPAEVAAALQAAAAAQVRR